MEEVICITRALSEEYFQRNNVNMSAPIALTCTSKGKTWHFNSKPESSLIDIASTFLQKEIKVFEFEDEEAPNIDGMCVEKRESANIFVNRMLNFCWSRFVVAKELTHLLLSDRETLYRTADPSQIDSIAQMLLTYSTANSKPEESEYLAYIGAIELLMPSEIASQIYNSTDGSSGWNGIAQKYKIPKSIVEHRYETRSSFDSIYSTHSYKNALLLERQRRANLNDNPNNPP